MSMNDEQFSEWLEACALRYAESRDALAQEHGIAAESDRHLDRETGLLHVTDSNGADRAFEVIALGTLADGTWTWGWADDALPKSLTRPARVLGQLEKETGLEIFQRPSFAADATMAQELSGMALHRLGGLGVLRCVEDGASLHLLLSAPHPA